MPAENSLVNLGDLAKPADTLIKKISGAIGILYEPKRIIKKARAEAEAEEIMELGKIRVDELKQKAMERVIKEEMKKQNNIESIIEKALPLVTSEANVSNVDDDWLANMFEKSKIVSNEEMQVVWSKILAGEANKPGSFSRKTITIVSELEMKDANLFTRLGAFCFMIGIPTIVVFDIENDLYTKRGINFTTLTHLDALGLICFDHLAGYVRQKLAKNITIGYFGKPISMELSKDDNNMISFGHVLLTQAGQELIKICGSEFSQDIYDYSLAKWKEEGVLVK